MPTQRESRRPGKLGALRGGDDTGMTLREVTAPKSPPRFPSPAPAKATPLPAPRWSRASAPGSSRCSGLWVLLSSGKVGNNHFGCFSLSFFFFSFFFSYLFRAGTFLGGRKKISERAPQNPHAACNYFNRGGNLGTQSSERRRDGALQLRGEGHGVGKRLHGGEESDARLGTL